MPKYNLWGHEVNIQISKEDFPSEQVQKELDELFFHPKHDYFTTSDGTKLHYRTYLPQTNNDDKTTPPPRPKAICIWQHGVDSHSGKGLQIKSDNNNNDDIGSYTNAALRARLMTKNGYALFGLDMRGHGYSEGDRFYVPDFKINCDDLDSFARFIASRYEDERVPVFLIGDSYGGCLALHVGRKWQNDGTTTTTGPKYFESLILNCPAIMSDLPPYAVVFTLRYLVAPLFPKWTPFFMPNPIHPERIWRLEQVRVHNTSDRIKKLGLQRNGLPFCLGTAVQLLEATESVREDVIPHLACPFYVSHGTDDAGIKVEGTEYLLEQCKTGEGDRKVNWVEGGYHDLYAEPNRVEILEGEMDWINDRIMKMKEEEKEGS